RRPRPGPGGSARPGREPGRLGRDLGVGGARPAGGGLAPRLRHPPDRRAAARAMRLAGRRVGPLGVGVILLGLYAVAVAATRPLAHGVRPLFEGIGTPPPYRWVKPPDAFAA